MKKRKQFSEKQYKKKNPHKAIVIKRAVKRAVKDYGETFKRLAFN